MPKLILLPGRDGTGRLFEDFAAALPADIDCTIIRYPNNSSDDYHDLARFAASFIPDSEPCYLLAESFSGPAGVILATQHSNIAGLILACSFIRNPRPAFAFARQLVSFLPIQDGPSGLKTALTLGKWQPAGLREKVHNAVACTPENVLRARLRQVLSADVREQARKIRVPVLSIKATRDRLVPARTFHQLAQCIPQAELTEIEGPHFILQVKPKECAKTVDDFIRTSNAGNEQASADARVRPYP